MIFWWFICGLVSAAVFLCWLNWWFETSCKYKDLWALVGLCMGGPITGVVVLIFIVGIWLSEFSFWDKEIW